jgi:hypothetical protein
MRLAVLALLCSGCIAGSIRAHTGVVADERGAGVQAGIALGWGYAGKRSAILETAGFATGQSPKAGLTGGFDYVRFPKPNDHRGNVAWRAGFGGVLLSHGEPNSVGVRVAALLLVRDNFRNDGHEKSISETTRTITAVGLELLGGMHVYDDDDRRFGGSASITLELFGLSRMSL